MIKRVYVIGLVLLLFCQMHGQAQNATNYTDNIMKEILKRQLEFGYDISNDVTTIGYYPFEESDMYATLKPIAEILKKRGYKSVINFDKKVYSIFGKLKKTSEIIYLSGFDKCSQPETINYYDQDGFRPDYYFDSNNNFITNLYFLPEIIDYKKDYPDLAKEEMSLISGYTNSSGDSIYIKRWNSVADLKSIRKKNIELLVNRNLYLFNDDKSKLPWLLQNDEDFMKKLVCSFGWTEDKKLVKYFLDKYLLTELYKNTEDELKNFGSILWHKDCDGKIIINEGALQAIKELTTPENTKYLEASYLYIYACLNDSVFFRGKRRSNMSFEEQSELLARFLYFFEKNYKNAKGYSYDYRFLTKFSQYGVIPCKEEIKRNNYYGLDGYKEMFEQATKEGNKIYELIQDEVIERGEEDYEFSRIAEQLGEADINPLDYKYPKFYGID